MNTKKLKPSGKIFAQLLGTAVLSAAIAGAVSYLIVTQLPNPSVKPNSIEKNTTTVVEDGTGNIGAVTPSTEGKHPEFKVLHELNQALVTVAEAVKPSVVTVFTEKVYRVQRSPFAMSPFFNDPFFQQFFGGNGMERQDPRNREKPDTPYEERKSQGMGSGVIVSADGYILTNNHVVSEADDIKVRTLDNQLLVAKVIGADPKTDVAVIKVEGKDLKPIAQGDSDKLQVGEIVLAVGSPMSANLNHTVTQGIVSAKGRSNVGLAEYEDFIQTDADINPGNSGGALVNMDGALVGINTAIVTRSGGSQGIGFAVPINMARTVMQSLIENGEVVRAWLGVQVQDLTPELAQAMDLKDTNAVLVAAVQEGSPAEKAGLLAGDVVLDLNGNKVQTAAELRNKVSILPPGTVVKVTIKRESAQKELSVKLERMPDDSAATEKSGKAKTEKSELLGFEVAGITPAIAQRYSLSPKEKGVVVVAVDPSSAAYASGVREGDVVNSLNKQNIVSVGDFKKLSSGLKEGATVLLKLSRRGGTLFLAFNLNG